MILLTNKTKLGQVRFDRKPVYEVRHKQPRYRMITIDGNRRSLTDWARHSGIPYATLAQRVHRGVQPEFLLVPTPKMTVSEIPEYRPPSTRIGWLIDNVWKVISEKPDQCIEWPFCRTKHGYGHVRYANTCHYTHRLAYVFAGYGLNAGEVVRHKCDNPPCFNVFHLESGTHADNVSDSCRRGRRYFNKIVKDLALSSNSCYDVPVTS